MPAITARDVAKEETAEFLDWFERYWEELEAFNDYPDPFSREQYAAVLDQPGNRRFWWVDRDGRHAGFCVFVLGTHWYRADVVDAYIDDFYIAPEARRGGAGTTVVQAVLDELRRLGVHMVALDVLPRNERGVAFWRSLGFGVETYRMAQFLDGSVIRPIEQ